jgi:hypothetical protein
MTRDKRPAMGLALLASAVLILLIALGSRGFADFDSALIGYAVGTVFAVAAVTYRYALWVTTRPPTRRYFRAGWASFLSWDNFRRYATLVPTALWRDILAQTFIRERSARRWIMHLCIFWGVVLSCLITFPLTFGWFHFTLVPPTSYELWFFGLPIFRFPIQAGTGFILFHALDFTALLLIIGLAIALWRRVSDVGLLATQRFAFDLLPLVLLFAIAVTGLALTASYTWWQGRFYSFLSLTHEVTIVGWLLSLPFGKFFHVVERPASIGVTLYQTVSQEGPTAGVRCRRCQRELPSRRFIDDLKTTLRELGQDYDLGDGLGSLQDYCPTCKRILRGEAYYQLMGRRFL